MKRVWFGTVICSAVAGMVCAQEAKSGAASGTPAAAVPEVKTGIEGLDWDGGADVRVRQEAMDNLPVRSPQGGTQANNNYLRIRPRVWGQVKNEDFKLYLRFADEFREYFHPRESRNYETPDEVLVDNLYLDLYNLFGGRVDVRVGRQDFLGAAGPTFGGGRVVCDGTPFDGSRTAFMDAVKATVKFDEKNSLDLLAIYNSPETELSWGHPKKRDGSEYKERPLNSINASGKDLAEWGGGLYFRSQEIERVPFELYYFYKRETKERLPTGAKLPGRFVNTWGVRVMPKLTEELTAELEGAVQAGEKDGGASTSGYMGYAGLTYKPLTDGAAKPWLTGSVYYLSGDTSRDDAGDNDHAWDPLWARWPQFSELYAYSFFYGVGYWSNLLYPSLEGGISGFAPGHKVRASAGPMYVAAEDDLGGGGGDLLGWLGVVRYDFPLLKNIFGKRGDLTGHLTAEVLDPGDYYASDKLAYFLRWEVIARF
jgi:hypothetical protein